MTPNYRNIGVIYAILLTLPSPLAAQANAPDLLSSLELTETSVLLISGITILSLAPGILIMITCFPFMVTVLSILRQGIGLQQSPPNMMLISMALFLTYFVMEPTFMTSWQTGISPLLEKEIGYEAAFKNTMIPFRDFMSLRVDPNTMDAMIALRPNAVDATTSENAPLSILVPSFMLSEVARAFQVGFLLFLPFLIIDLVVAAILMSMGMMMVPPASVSLPFKLAFFVVADGWALVSSGLVSGYF